MMTITGHVGQNGTAATPRAYPKRFNAQRAAIATLGPEAREGFEFITSQLDDGKWVWKATDEVPPMTAQQAKVNGVAYHPPVSPGPDDANLAGTNGVGAHPLDVPAGLKRENTPEQRAKVARLTKADREREIRNPGGRGRKIVDPKNVKTGATGFGVAVVGGGLKSVGAKPKSPRKSGKLPVPPPRGAKKGQKGVKAPRPKKRTSEARQGSMGPRDGSKTALVAGLLARKEGCTTAEVLAACNWPAVSMPAMAKAIGVKLRKEKDGKVSRYWAA